MQIFILKYKINWFLLPNWRNFAAQLGNKFFPVGQQIQAFWHCSQMEEGHTSPRPFSAFLGGKIFFPREVAKFFKYLVLFFGAE